MTGLWPVTLSLGAVGALLLVFAGLYNRLVSLRNAAEAAWKQVDVQLLRRHDLIPNLVETVKGYATHERGALEAVTRARAEAEQGRQAADVSATARAEGALGPALVHLTALAEAYPALRADAQFLRLQSELSDTENRLAAARRAYNESVQAYNEAMQQVPARFIAGWGRFTPAVYWSLPEESAAREAPRVAF